MSDVSTTGPFEGNHATPAIANNSPLTYGEAIKLWAVLTDDALPDDHAIWPVLRQWLTTAHAAHAHLSG
jgi:hypothetical protein